MFGTISLGSESDRSTDMDRSITHEHTRPTAATGRSVPCGRSPVARPASLLDFRRAGTQPRNETVARFASVPYRGEQFEHSFSGSPTPAGLERPATRGCAPAAAVGHGQAGRNRGITQTGRQTRCFHATGFDRTAAFRRNATLANCAHRADPGALARRRPGQTCAGHSA